MGQKDYAQNDYFKDKVRFADVCNGILYQGQPVIQPEELQEMNSDIVYYDGKNTLHKLIPDKVMMWKGICIGIAGIESQTNVDYHMVFRVMKAEALSYARQWSDLEKEYRRDGTLTEHAVFEWTSIGKESRFIPIIMLVIYFGTDKEWDGARCLYDMLDISEELKPYVNNYKMNLFDYHECDDFSIFKTENRLLFETLACSGDKRKMKAFFKDKSHEYENLDMTTKLLICDLLGFREDVFLKKRIKEGVHMCKAIQEMFDDALAEGWDTGMIQSIRNLSTSQNISTDQAMEMLLIPEADRERYTELLS